MVDDAARRQVEDMMLDYAHCIDDDRLEDWPGFFTEDGRYRIVTRENFERGLPVGVMTCTSRGMMQDRIVSLRNANIYEPHVYRHLVSAIRVRDGEAAGEYAVQSGFAVIRTMQEGGMDVFAAGRYLDRVAIENGGARLRERVCVLDSRRVDTLIVIPL